VTRRRETGSVLLGSVLCALLGCSGSPPTDINYGNEAGAGFEAPPRDVNVPEDGAVDMRAVDMGRAAPDAGSAEDTGVTDQDAGVDY
jgi:hypothetical protein